MSRIKILSSIIIIFSIFVFSNLSYPQDTSKILLTGKIISDKEDVLTSILVTLKNYTTPESYTAVTDENGFYSFEVNEGRYIISIERNGFEKYSQVINAEKSSANVFNITLIEKSTYTTEQITVESEFRQRQEDLRTSMYNVLPTEVKMLPGAIEDVMRSLKSLPGVTAPNDFTSQLVVRGSGPDQNLIVMDDVEIFNPYRLYGLVSMFNPETLQDITLITGGFPAKYGDRLSAVLDVNNKEGVRDKTFSMITNVNIASANVIVQGKNPFKIPGSWIVSSRRTYYDLILGPFAKSAGLITDDSSLPNFRDVQFKFAFGPFKKSKFLINGIFSSDGVDVIPGSERTNPDSVTAKDVTNNNVLSASWVYLPNSKFLSKTTASWYKNTGDNNFEGDILDPLIDREGLTPGQRDSLKAIGALLGFKFDSKYNFRKYSIVNKSTLFAGKNYFEFGGGLDLIRTDITYTLNLDEAFKSFIRSQPNAQAILEDFSITGNDNLRASVYGQGRFKAGDKIYYQPSLRVDYYSFLKRVYISPRFNVGYSIDPVTTIRSSVGLYYQSPGYEKLVDGQTFYDLTGSAGDNLKAERSTHFVLGIDRWLNNEWNAKIEGYYKKFDDLITQKRVTNYRYEFTLADPTITDPAYIGDPANWIRSDTKLAYDSITTTPINGVTGNAYGIEFSLEKKYSGPDSKFSGWINYAYSFANRTRDGLEYPFRFDQRHVVNIVANYRFNKTFELGARWTYASNFPYTPPVGITPRVSRDSLVVNPFTQQVIFNLDFGDDVNRFSQVRPAYHRLDVRFSAYTKFWNTDWVFYIDVINAYNRKNVLSYDYDLTSDYQIKRNTVGMFPILPTIGVNARF
ncbi:MAG: TonB-dependent receptor [Ignavibacteria bacterium]|nr:TonB-dependent receptor [Ignavibacteria bacterium]